jgi:hypothetical protein
VGLVGLLFLIIRREYSELSTSCTLKNREFRIFNILAVFGSLGSGIGRFLLHNGDIAIVSQAVPRRITMKVSEGTKIHFLLTALFLIALFLQGCI